MRKLILIIILIVAAVVSALFFAQNDGPIEIKYFGGSVEWQMNWALISIFVIGLIVGVSSMLTSLLATKLKLANANRKLANHEKEISNLRSLPIKDDY